MLHVTKVTNRLISTSCICEDWRATTGDKIYYHEVSCYAIIGTTYSVHVKLITTLFYGLAYCRTLTKEEAALYIVIIIIMPLSLF